MDPEYIRELFAAFGRVGIQRMFGGAGLYADGVMFALVTDDIIYLKADEAGAPLFEAEGCAPFTYDTKKGRRVSTSYWRVPDRLYDDPDELAGWARRALATARAKAARKKTAGRAKPVRAKPPRGTSARTAKKMKVAPKRPGSATRRRAKPRGRSRK